jgi:hypothetical protein
MLKSLLAFVLIVMACAAHAQSPDGSRLTPSQSGSLATVPGTWTFGATATQPYGYPILLNGQPAASGLAVLMEVANGGNLYVENGNGLWYKWENNGWSAVSGDPLPPAPTNVTLTANPSSVLAGHAMTLTYGSAGATSCTSPDFTVSGTSGSASAMPAATMTYHLTCSNVGGSTSATANVTVTQPVIVNLNVNAKYDPADTVTDGVVKKLQQNDCATALPCLRVR